jgi:ectoine hydroxylase-related dioxygenase (phytanoyl-CoA dioxygenase family)
VLPNVLPPAVVADVNRVLDRIEQTPEAQYPPAVTLSKPRSPEELYVSNVVEADPTLHQLIDVEPVVDVVREVSLNLFRLNHTYAIYRWQKGYTYLHMGSVPLHPKATYMCQNGQIFSLLTKAVFPMLNHDEADGCFAVVPGSHKAAFKRPWGDHPDENPALMAVPAQPGDAVIFTEALTHGSTVNRSGRPRRTVYFCYSVGYMPDWGKLGLNFSDGLMDAVTPNQREILRLKDR